MSLDSDKRPHFSKTISYGTLLTLLVVIGAQFVSYGKEVAKVETVVKNVSEIKRNMKQHVDKESLKQMLENRDIQIKNLSEKVAKVDAKIDRNQQLIIELLQRTPKKQ